ncbi:pilus assembly protein N-terminal domain-containing protein [Aquamicrobium segne]|uniref:Pilus assembly protein N-terminal domain-containing protein n=1 Tax=Aquamicrobium segne TaxID=469547 RepID=A0ABW0GUE2_9HYPH
MATETEPAQAEAVTLSAQASGIEVVMNQARLIKLSRPADTIIVGNSSIADASVQDATTLVLTGRGFGTTNLVVIDQEGAPILDEQITVSRQTASTVRVYRRSNVQTLSCTPYCESSFQSEAERISDSQTGGY